MSRKLIIFIVLIIMGVTGVSYWQQRSQSNNPIAKEKQIVANTDLESNINTFMESQVSENDLGRENYFCSNILYGYDSKYTYTWVYCSGFTIKNDGKIEQGTAFSIPTRLEYVQPHFEIINFKQPGDGSLYASTLRVLFPQKYYDKAIAHPPNAEIEKLDQTVRNKTKAVIQIKEKFPELKDYPSDKLPSRSIIIEENKDDELYVAFIQNGSGRPIIEARCFTINNSKIVDDRQFVPNISDDGIYFSARECKSIK